MKKRFMSLMVALSMLMSIGIIVPGSASAATSGTCGENLTWVLDDAGTLTISGTGEMINWEAHEILPWENSYDSITKVVIENGVTSIGERAFYGCYVLTSITIPDSVTSIGEGAFSLCYGLTSITIPDSVTSIGERAFYGCESLTSITIPDSVTSIGERAFYSCDSLTSINVDGNNECYSSMDGNLYNKDKTTLKQYAIGKTATQFTIPDSVTSIGNSAFLWCESLTSITIPDSVTSIGKSAFSFCTSLTSITIPDSVTNIGESVFIACDGLKTIYYTGSEEQWNAIKVADETLQSYNIVFNYDPITVTYNSERIIFDQEPIIEDERTLVPLRAIFEKLGAEVGWDGNTQTVTATKGDTLISLQINSAEMYVNGNAKVLDVPAKIVNERTLVPVRAISEAFGCGVAWDGDSRTVIITQ